MTAHCIQCRRKFEQLNANHQFCAPDCRKAFDKEERDFKRAQPVPFNIPKPKAPGGQVMNFGDSAEL